MRTPMSQTTDRRGAIDVTIGNVEDHGSCSQFGQERSRRRGFLTGLVSGRIKRDRGPSSTVTRRLPRTHMLPGKARIFVEPVVKIVMDATRAQTRQVWKCALIEKSLRQGNVEPVQSDHQYTWRHHLSSPAS